VADDQPKMWIVGGPNGAGKTTLARAFLGGLAGTAAYINADEVQKSLGPHGGSILAAGRRVIVTIEEHIAARSSFAVETTLASLRYVTMARRLRAEGWWIGFLYCGLRDQELSVARVAQRVREGGHDVSEADIRRRYGRSCANVRMYVDVSDQVLIFDNSGDTPSPVNVWRDGQLDLGVLPWGSGSDE
jgi:predicted ABC-type ATPase